MWLSWLECHPHTSKGWGFDSQSRHLPRLRVQSQVVRVSMGGNQLRFLSLSLPLFLKSINIKFLKKLHEHYNLLQKIQIWDNRGENDSHPQTILSWSGRLPCDRCLLWISYRVLIRCAVIISRSLNTPHLPGVSGWLDGGSWRRRTEIKCCRNKHLFPLAIPVEAGVWVFFAISFLGFSTRPWVEATGI